MAKYDYSNPDRFFAEPLQKYTLTPLALSILCLIPLAIYSRIRGDGGAWSNGTPFEYLISGLLILTFGSLIPYTILYYVRGWSNKQKWKMKDYIKEDAEKWRAEHPNETPSMKPFIILFIVVVGFLGVGIYIWWSIDDVVDFNILHEQIRTNQTYVDSLDCKKIQTTQGLLNNAWSLRQQDEIEQLKIDFKQLAIDKKCDFVIGEVKP